MITKMPNIDNVMESLRSINDCIYYAETRR